METSQNREKDAPTDSLARLRLDRAQRKLSRVRKIIDEANRNTAPIPPRLLKKLRSAEHQVELAQLSLQQVRTRS